MPLCGVIAQPPCLGTRTASSPASAAISPKWAGRLHPKKNPSAGGMARSDGSREAPGWAFLTTDYPPPRLAALTPSREGIQPDFLFHITPRPQRCASTPETDSPPGAVKKFEICGKHGVRA